MNLDKKFQKLNQKYPDFFIESNVKEIKMSNDGIYLFVCKKFLGIHEIVTSSSGKILAEIVSYSEMK